MVFSGVGKTREELRRALDDGIGQFNIELEDEGNAISELAVAMGKRAVAVLRVNPDVDAKTHAKISTGKKENKFGVPIDQAGAIYARLSRLPGLDMRGVALHIGSQVFDLAPLEAGYARIGTVVAELRAAGFAIDRVDLGGGLGVPYQRGQIPPEPAEYGQMVARVTKVIWVKPGVINPYVIVDAAMNDLARPALYDAWHDFEAVRPTGERMVANIAGPVCESTDTFAMARDIDSVKPGDLAVFRTAGAYGATMASTYNSRGFVAEVMVEALIAAERLPEWLLD